VCLGLFIGFAEPLVRFFIKEEKSIEFGARFMRVIAFAAPLCSVTYLINTVFQAAGQRYKSLLLSVMRKGIADVPLMALFSLTLGMGEMGVVIATPVAEIISAGVAVILYVRFAKHLSALEKEVASSSDG
jgi:Na+-driven multidrug efflux pump